MTGIIPAVGGGMTGMVPAIGGGITGIVPPVDGAAPAEEASAGGVTAFGACAGAVPAGGTEV